MLVQNPSQPMSMSVMDSPTLARVKRAMLRHEDGTFLRHGNESTSKRENAHLERNFYTQSLLSTTSDRDSSHAIKKGLLFQLRDRLLSRWKERYFILTRDYLHCFRRASGSDRISEMGPFRYKVKLVDVENVQWENRKTYSIVTLVLGREGKIFLRTTLGLEEWYELLEECTLRSKERRRALRHSYDYKPKDLRDNNNTSDSLDDWLRAHDRIPMGRLAYPDDSVSTRRGEINLRQNTNWNLQKQSEDDQEWDDPYGENRLSLLTDIDINNYETDTMGAPSLKSFRLNEDVLCVQSPSFRAAGSFRSTRDSNLGSNKRGCDRERDLERITTSSQLIDNNGHIIKFRERSYSDIQRVDKRHWRTLHLDARNLN